MLSRINFQNGVRLLASGFRYRRDFRNQVALAETRASVGRFLFPYHGLMLISRRREGNPEAGS